MAITVKHKFVSAIPDGADATVVRPSNWNDDHDLTGTIPVANGGTGASTLTGYVYGNGTSAMTASTTVPSTAITGLGTMSTQNANAVAVTGGSVDGTTIGATTASTGIFTYASTTSYTSTTPALSYNASNSCFVNGATVSGSYLQNIMQNKSATAGASTNFAVSNNLGTDSTYYGEFGMNSSVFSASTPADYFSINNGVYYSGHDGDISIGSGNGYKTYFAWGTTGQSAHVINVTGAIGLNTNLGTTPALSGTTNFGTSGQVLTSGGSAATPTWTTPATGTVTSVAATVPALFSISGSPITSSGTLAMTYSGTALPAANGGTGQTVYAVGDIVYASTTTALSKLADVATGNALISGGVGVAPSYGKIGLTTHVSGTLPIANGGTNATTASITSFNNITGYTASGATGTTSTNLVFSTAPTVTNPTLTGFIETVYAATGTTPALSPTNGTIQTWTLSGSSTPTAGTWTAGASLSLQITASTNTITWSSMPVTWMGGTAPTLSTTVTTNIELWKIGSTIYGALVGLA